MFSCNKTLILLSYHVFLWHRMRGNKLKCVMCIKAHIMCFWWVSQPNFSSYLNNRGQFTTGFPRKKKKCVILTVKCSGRDETTGRSYFPKIVIHVKQGQRMSPAKLYIEGEQQSIGLFTEERLRSFPIQQYENQGTDSLPGSNDLSVHRYESSIH